MQLTLVVGPPGRSGERNTSEGGARTPRFSSANGAPQRLFEVGVGLGELYFFGAVLAWVSYTLIVRYWLRGIDPVMSTTGAVCWGLLMLGVLAGFEVLHGAATCPNPKQWGAIAFFGLAGTTLAFVWYNNPIGMIGATRATQFTNLVPVFGVLFSVLLLGEPVQVADLLGGVTVMLGVMWVNRGSAQTSDPTPRGQA